MASYNNSKISRAGLDKILLLLLLPGLLASVFLAAGRLRIENSSRDVELTLDYVEMQTLSVSTGVAIPSLLEKFKSVGITGVAVGEDVLGTLVNTGQANYDQNNTATGPSTSLLINDPALSAHVYKSLEARLDPKLISRQMSGTAGEHGALVTAVIKAAPATLNSIGIGLPMDAVEMAQGAGLAVVARIQNSPALTRRAVDAAFVDLKGLGITRIICGGEDVFGFRGLIPYVADKIMADNFTYGSIEFAKQRGDAGMCEKLKGAYIRIHSIPVAEMAGMTPSTAIERFTRAVKERGIRLCYVRLPATSGDDPLGDNLSFVSSISKEIEDAGFSMGPAKPFEESPRPIWAMALIALAVAAGGVLLIDSLMSLSPSAKYGLLVAAAVVGVGLVVVAEKGRQGMALLSALIFPTLGVTALIGRYFDSQTEEKSALRKTICIFLGASAFTLVGAALIVGLLADRSYVVKLNQFVGIKPSTVLPIMLVGFAMCAGLPIFNKPFAEVKGEVSANIKKLVSHPLFIWHTIAVIGALGIVGFAVLRSGNDPGVGVSGIELKFRAILDRLLVVRPRTKEFLIGHPALFVGIALLLKRNRGWGLPLAAFGVIGQVSLLNTFCHIHTPLMVSVIRAFNGLWLGLLIGILAWFLLDRRTREVSQDG